MPASEAYAIRRGGAERLLQFSLAYGLGAVDYIIAMAFAAPAGVAGEETEEDTGADTALEGEDTREDKRTQANGYRPSFLQYLQRQRLQ